uniref:Reverse transcriptase n=1 Tax=Haemonchus placei TaxID=6290 RepID=A0A0N4X448_HAEPC
LKGLYSVFMYWILESVNKSKRSHAIAMWIIRYKGYCRKHAINSWIDFLTPFERSSNLKSILHSKQRRHKSTASSILGDRNKLYDGECIVSTTENTT